MSLYTLNKRTVLSSFIWCPKPPLQVNFTFTMKSARFKIWNWVIGFRLIMWWYHSNVDIQRIYNIYDFALLFSYYSGINGCHFYASFNPDCYIFGDSTASWQNARKYCQDRNADLVVINNEDENNNITGIALFVLSLMFTLNWKHIFDWGIRYIMLQGKTWNL